MKKIVGNIVKITGVCGGLYVGGWLMFVQPIIQACSAFDSGSLTATIVGFTILKCIFASVVGWLIAVAGMFFGTLISD